MAFCRTCSKYAKVKRLQWPQWFLVLMIANGFTVFALPKVIALGYDAAAGKNHDAGTVKRSVLNDSETTVDDLENVKEFDMPSVILTTTGAVYLTTNATKSLMSSPRVC